MLRLISLAAFCSMASMRVCDPMLVALSLEYKITTGDASAVIAAFAVAYGVLQLVYGPLGDRVGKVRVIIGATAACAVFSAMTALAPSFSLLVVARAAMGAAAAGIIPLSMAWIGDEVAYEQRQETLARLMVATVTGMMAGQWFGGFATETLGWRAALLALTGYAVLTLALVALRMPETLARPNPHALQPGVLLRTWGTVLRHPTFWAFSLLTTAAYGGLFTFLASSSFVFIEVLGLSRTQYGWVLLSTALAYFVGTFVCRTLLARHGLRRTVALAGALSLSGGTLMTLVAWAGWHQPWALLAPFYLFMLGHGIHQPCGQSGAVGPFPQAAGVASALNGFMMMLAAFAIGGWVGAHLDGSIWPLVNGVWFWSVLLAAIAWTLVQQFGEPRERP